MLDSVEKLVLANNRIADLERQLAEVTAERDKLREVLASLISEQLSPNEWGIKCIEDHNAIIKEALGKYK